MSMRSRAWFAEIALRFVAAGAVAGLLAGLVVHARRVLENAYLEQGLRHLAARTVAEGAWDWAVAGAVVALAFLAGAAVLWPAGRFWRGDWRWGAAEAVAATPVLAAYVSGGLYLNRAKLPGLFELPSIAANLGLTALALGGWWSLARLTRGFILDPPAWTARLPGAPALILPLCVGLAAAGSPLLAAPQRLERPGPNVLLILIDALRPDRLGLYGYERDTSPHLDALASESWVFTEAVAVAPWTKPSVASLFTSLYPTSHGIGTGGWIRSDGAGSASADVLHPELQTLAEILADGGYETVAFGKNPHLIPRFGFQQGFGRYELDLSGENWLSSMDVLPRFWRWLDESPDGFFAYLHFVDVHFPYLPPEPYARRWAGSPPELDYNTVEFMNWAQKRERDGPLELAQDVARHMSDSYDEEIRFLDDQIGTLLADLQERGLYEEMLVIVMSDHGEEFLEHGEIAHATSLYDVLLRIPLIVKFPCPGPYCGHRVVERQVEILDLMPTVLELVGLHPPSGIQGRSLLRPPGPDDRLVAVGAYGEFVSLRTAGFKYIASTGDDTQELYDLRADPGETHNLVSERPSVAASFQSRLQAWRDALPDTASRRPATVTIDEQTRKALEALGYGE